MKQTIQFALAIAASAAAMFAYMYEAPPERVVQEVAHQTTSDTTITAQAAIPQQSATQTKSQERELTAAELADIDPASIDWEAMRAGYKDVVFGDYPMASPLSVLITDFSPEEIAAYNKLHAVPFNPVIGKECGLLRAAPSKDFDEAYGLESRENVIENCMPVRERPEHPYHKLSVSELRELVELNNDAEAAEIAVSKASRNPQESLFFALNAAALSGKSGPVLRASILASTFSASLDRDPKHVLADAEAHLVLERVAQLLGDPRVKSSGADRLSWLHDRGVTEKEIQQTLSNVEKTADEILQLLGEIQRDKTGATSILELTNA
jgi:hypothetical protein